MPLLHSARHRRRGAPPRAGLRGYKHRPVGCRGHGRIYLDTARLRARDMAHTLRHGLRQQRPLKLSCRLVVRRESGPRWTALDPRLRP